MEENEPQSQPRYLQLQSHQASVSHVLHYTAFLPPIPGRRELDSFVPVGLPTHQVLRPPDILTRRQRYPTLSHGLALDGSITICGSLLSRRLGS